MTKCRRASTRSESARLRQPWRRRVTLNEDYGRRYGSAAITRARDLPRGRAGVFTGHRVGDDGWRESRREHKTRRARAIFRAQSNA